MGIDAEDILVCVWSCLKFFMNTSCKCVQKHPFVAGILLFIFNLYVFFNLFVSFLPFLVCVAVLLRVFWTTGGLTTIDVEGDEKTKDRMPCKKSVSVKDDVVANRKMCPSLLKQKSRRTNVKRRSKEWDAQADKESKTFNDDLICISALIGKNTKAVKKEKENYSFVDRESSIAEVPAADNIQVLDENHSLLDQSDLSESQLLSSSDDSDERTDTFDDGGIGEEAQADENKQAVQWTDDDQRNLMDLGFSEIERNKRLESLIARRRARKLFKMQIEKGLIDLDTLLPSQIAPIFVTRNNPYDFTEGFNEIDSLHTPGSAPPILLPKQNPFDLPYDPLEEKPNLMADSFQQEFAAAHHKDMLYCRHESFCLGDSFPLESKLRASEGLGFSRFRKQSDMGPHDKRVERILSGKGEHDEIIEELLSKLGDDDTPHSVSTPNNVENEATSSIQAPTTSVEPKDEGNRETHNVDVMSTRGEVNMDPHVTDESNNYSTSSLSEEDDEQTYSANGSDLTQGAISKLGRVPPKPLYDSSPSANERSRLEDRLFYVDRNICHTPTCSIASDLQVEVSEVGSPPLTIDGTCSPTDRESLNLDGDFEREYMWGASSQSSRTEENESKLREVRGLSEKDIAGLRFSGMNINNKDVVSSSIPSQQGEELDDACSLSSSITDIHGESQSNLMNFDEKTYNDVRKAVIEVGNSRTSSSSHAPSPDNKEETMQLKEKLGAHPSVNPQESSESSDPPDETTKKVNVINDVKDPAANAIDDLKDEKNNKDKDSGAQMPKPKEGTTLGSSSNLEGNSVSPAELQSPLDTIQPPNKEKKNSNHIEGGLQKVTENEGREDMVKLIDGDRKNLNLIQDSKVEQSTAGSGLYEVKQISDDPTASAVQKNLVTEDVPINLTSSASQDIPKDVSSSDSNPKKAMDAPIYDLGHKVKSNSSEEKPHDSTTLNTPQNGKHLVEESTGHQSNTRDSEKLQEPCKPPEKSTEEANRILKKPADETGNVLQKATEAAIGSKNPVEETRSVSQKETEAIAELKKPAEEIGSVSQKATETAAELKNPTEKIENVSAKATGAAAELKKPAEETGSILERAKEATAELRKPVEESGSQKTTQGAAELKKPVEETGSVSQKEAGATAELKKSAEETGSVSQKALGELAELTKTAEETGSLSEKPTEPTTELEKPVEEIEIVSKTAAELRKPSEVGNVSQKPSVAISELKTPDEKTESVSGKATEALAELKKPAEEIENVSHKATEAVAELKKPAEEIKT